MLHNAIVDLHKVKANLEGALHSKLLQLHSSSGHAETHVTGFNNLIVAIKHVEEEIERRTAKPTKGKAAAE